MIPRMNVGQIIAMLKDYNPNDEVMIYSSSHKLGHITGIDAEMSNRKGAIVLTYDYDVVITVMETEQERIDKQIAQLTELRGKIDRKLINKELNKEKKKKQKWVPRETKTLEEQLLAGFIPTGKRGRPRKIDLNELSASLRTVLTPTKLSEMTPEEVNELLVKINKEIDGDR